MKEEQLLDTQENLQFRNHLPFSTLLFQLENRTLLQSRSMPQRRNHSWLHLH